MKKHWLVLVCCCGLAAASIGISINSSGVFYTPVSKNLHMLRGTFSMHMTLFSLATAMMSLFVPKIYEKFAFKEVLTISVIVAVASTAAMALGKNALTFYILGTVRGMSTSLFSIVPITIIINGWFEKKHGLATSIAFGFSGLGGTICSPILSSIISSFNWQMGYLLKAILILLLCLPACIYPFKMTAFDEGLVPYGYQERKETIQKQTTSSFHFISVSFIAFFIFGMLISCITSVTQHLPGYGESLGYPLTTCAMLLSAGMMGNIVSKLIIGSLSDYFGEMKATLMMIGVNILGIILLMIGKSMVLLIIGAFMFGSCYSLGAVAIPLLTKYFFKTENYAKAFPTISFASNVGAAISLSMVGYIYDFFGSYLYAFIIALVMILISLALLFIVTKTKEN